jgi:hypothetical protein
LDGLLGRVYPEASQQTPQPKQVDVVAVLEQSRQAVADLIQAILQPPVILTNAQLREIGMALVNLTETAMQAQAQLKIAEKLYHE